MRLWKAVRVCSAGVVLAATLSTTGSDTLAADPAAGARSGRSGVSGLLDRLRNRSVEDRWRAVNDKWRVGPSPTEDASPLPPPKPLLKPIPYPAAGHVPSRPALQVETSAPLPLPQESASPPQTGRASVRTVQNSSETNAGDATQRNQWELQPIQEILPYLDYAPVEADEGDVTTERVPTEVALDAVGDGGPGPFAGRAMPDTVFSWHASNLYHNPLYFQDVQLERYGHTHHDLIQPFVSTGRFGVQLLGLPYQMAIHPIHKHMYTLGYYRPGECAPKKYYQIPINEDAIAAQTLSVLGGVWIFP